MDNQRSVFITGGTGFIGRALIPQLAERGHTVRALVRRGSEAKLPRGAAAVTGDPLRGDTFAAQVAPADTFVQLVGTPSPSPARAAQFRSVDLESARVAVAAARDAAVRHFIYLSVAQPAPIMQEYQAARAEGEQLVRASGMNASIVRPWYVIGPGRRWPLVLAPIYFVLERIPSTRERAIRLGLVTLDEMVAALVQSIEQPAAGVRLLETAQIRAATIPANMAV